MVEILLNAPTRADPNKPNGQGNTPLHRAAERGHTETVQVLLSSSADPNVSNTDGETPLHRAVSYGCSEVVALLLKEPSVNMDAIDNLGQTPLHHAVKNDMTTEVRSLLKASASPNVFDNSGHTPLHLGIFSSCKMVRILLRKADPNLKNNINGETPLHMAIRTRQAWGKAGWLRTEHTNTIKLLLRHAASPTEHNNDKKTPLDLAYSLNDTQLTNLLLHGKRGRTQPCTQPYSGENRAKRRKKDRLLLPGVPG